MCSAIYILTSIVGLVMKPDLSYLDYVLMSLLDQGLISSDKAHSIYTEAESTGVMPEFDFISNSQVGG